MDTNVTPPTDNQKPGRHRATRRRSRSAQGHTRAIQVLKTLTTLVVALTRMIVVIFHVKGGQ